MSQLLRRIIAVIALVLMVPFLVFLIMSLGAYKGMGGIAPAIAGALFCVIMVLFLIIKMDDRRKKHLENMNEAVSKDLESGEAKLDIEISEGKAIELEEGVEAVEKEGVSATEIEVKETKKDIKK